MKRLHVRTSISDIMLRLQRANLSVQKKVLLQAVQYLFQVCGVNAELHGFVVEKISLKNVPLEVIVTM